MDAEAADPTTVRLSIDGEPRLAPRNRRLIEVARQHGAYVPGWCHHPSMRPAVELEGVDRVYRPVDGPVATPPRGPGGLKEARARGVAVRGEAGPYGGCGLCVVEVDGEPARACETRARDGMAVRTRTDEVRALQRAAMGELFRHHPHACLDCPQKEGCDRITCSMNVPEEARCCDLLGNCELEKSAEEIGLAWAEVPSYRPLGRPAQTAPVLEVNWELCVACLRCVGVCEDHVGAGVWRFTREREADRGSEVTVGLKAETLAEAGCKFCTACVVACPTGALSYHGAPDERLPLEFRDSLAPVPFPGRALALTRAVVESEVPDAAGVYTLYDEDGEVVAITGVAHLRGSLLGEVSAATAARFDYQRDENFTRRETERIERYVRKHGHMPGAGGMMDDLF